MQIKTLAGVLLIFSGHGFGRAGIIGTDLGIRPVFGILMKRDCMESRGVRRKPGGGRSKLWMSIMFILVLLVIWVYFNLGAIEEFFVVSQERDRHLGEVERLEKQAAELLAEKERLEEGGFANEKAARETYKYVKPGEKIIFLEEEKSGQAE